MMFKSSRMKKFVTISLTCCILALSGQGFAFAKGSTHQLANKAKTQIARVPRGSITLTINLSGSQPWVDTGINLNVGSYVLITATGTVTPCGTCGSVTPDGDPGLGNEDFLAPGVAAFSLIGRIGNSVPHKVGSKAQFVSYAAGRLGLGFNDNVFTDNTGGFSVTITVWG